MNEPHGQKQVGRETTEVKWKSGVKHRHLKHTMKHCIALFYVSLFVFFFDKLLE